MPGVLLLPEPDVGHWVHLTAGPGLTAARDCAGSQASSPTVDLAVVARISFRNTVNWIEPRCSRRGDLMSPYNLGRDFGCKRDGAPGQRITAPALLLADSSASATPSCPQWMTSQSGTGCAAHPGQLFAANPRRTAARASGRGAFARSPSYTGRVAALKRSAKASD